MAKSIGIDLGTTNSVAAIKQLQTRVLPNAQGDPITPSCVGLNEQDEIVVGRDALQWRRQDPASTVVAVKRLMGRSIQDELVQQIVAEGRLGYAIGPHPRGTENSLAILLRGRAYTPEQISAEILGQLRRDAAAALSDEVDHAVITVPAYFNDKQKHATRTAAALAGLRVRRLLPEPTAAAIAFGVDEVHGDEARTILVVDFGGGTLDLSVLTISGGQIIELGKGGDMWLGGEEIDRLIADRVLDQTGWEQGLDDVRALVAALEPRQRSRFWAELRDQAERAKLRLSSERTAWVEIVGLLRDAEGEAVDVCVELTREVLEELIAPIITRVIELCRGLLGQLHLAPALLDNVLLVGGSAQIPALVAALQAELGEQRVLLHGRPMLAVAEGAAILSHRLADSVECPACGREATQADARCPGCGFDLERYTIEQGVLEIVHAAAHDYFIRLENDEQHLVLPKGTPLPCRVSEPLELVSADQRLAHLKFFNEVNGAHESIGDLWLGIDPRAPQGGTAEQDGPVRVIMTLEIDENNLIEVGAALQNDPGLRVSRALSRGQADERLYRALEETILEANRRGYGAYKAQDIELRALSAIEEINRVIDPQTGALDEARHARAANKIDKTLKLADADQASRPTIAYGQYALGRWGFAIPPERQAAIRDGIERLQQMDEEGSLEDNIAACQDLHDTLTQLGPVNMLMEIEQAGDLCQEHDPRRAARFQGALERIVQAITDRDLARVKDLIPEVHAEASEVVKRYAQGTVVIAKDLRQGREHARDEAR